MPSDAFACRCSPEARADAETWLREVLPGLPADEERIGEDSSLLGAREMDLTEQLITALSEESYNDRGKWIEIGTGHDMWCVVVVTEGERRVRVEYDYGLLPHALAKAMLLLREEETSEPTGT